MLIPLCPWIIRGVTEKKMCGAFHRRNTTMKIMWKGDLLSSTAL